jgi:hypothetical protein
VRGRDYSRGIVPAVGELDGEGLETGVGGELPLEVLVVGGGVAGYVGGGRCAAAVAGVGPGVGADGAGVGVGVGEED